MKKNKDTWSNCTAARSTLQYTFCWQRVKQNVNHSPFWMTSHGGFLHKLLMYGCAHQVYVWVTSSSVIIVSFSSNQNTAKIYTQKSSSWRRTSHCQAFCNWLSYCSNCPNDSSPGPTTWRHLQPDRQTDSTIACVWMTKAKRSTSQRSYFSPLIQWSIKC